MREEVDINHWARRSQFQFFKKFEEPFWGVTVRIDCTLAYAWAKANEVSFYLYYLYQSMRAVNAIENFRYRLEGEKVYLYDSVGASATVLRENGTFGFSYVDYHELFSDFEVSANKEFLRVRAREDLVPGSATANVVHYSSLPWLDFTGLSHARLFSRPDSAPKISFGKMSDQNGIKTMPVSIHVHHALVDGFHVGQHVDLFQELMNKGL
jgi:chloramphenicol O-acetyltransferase type A